MKKKTDKMDQIAKLLPENLDEDIAIEIANLVSEKITEEVQKAREDLAVKTSAFIRGQIEKLKEQALKELELENETFRNAFLFEHIKSLMSIELSPDDEVNAVNLLALEHSELGKKVEVLTSELDRVLKENVQYKGVIKIQNDKLRIAEDKIKDVTNKLQEEASKRKANTDGDAFVISEENFSSKKAKEAKEKAVKVNVGSVDNEFLTEDVLRLFKRG